MFAIIYIDINVKNEAYNILTFIYNFDCYVSNESFIYQKEYILSTWLRAQVVLEMALIQRVELH